MWESALKTRFESVPPSPLGVRRLLENGKGPLVIVSRHGLGDNLFFSACFAPLRERFQELFFCSAVNAYTAIFHNSSLVRPLYLGGLNGANLGLNSPEGFCRHFEGLGVDLGVARAPVYHFGLFEPGLPYSDQRAFVKGRRNLVELFGTGPDACDVPRYHVAPDVASKAFVDEALDRWLRGREMIAIARYGHTDVGKNFGHDSAETLATADAIDAAFPGRFCFLSLDFIPGDHSADGRRHNVRSVYGFLPCDSAALHHLLSRSTLLMTVPTGAMLVGATIPTLKIVTLWKEMHPFHLLDPQFGSENPMHAIVATDELANVRFAAEWPRAAQEALISRWRMLTAPVTSASVAPYVIRLLENP
jgi:hypothetical protein